MKLFHYELKKTILSKGFKAVCLALLVVSVLLGLVFAGKPSYDVQAVDAIVREYRDDPNAVLERYHGLEEAYNEYRNLLYSDLEIEIDIPEAVIEYEQYKLAFEKINRQKTYIEKLDKTIHELDKQQSVISAEQRVVNDILKNVYQKNKSLRLGTGDMSGLSNLFSLLGYLRWHSATDSGEVNCYFMLLCMAEDILCLLKQLFAWFVQWCRALSQSRSPLGSILSQVALPHLVNIFKTACPLLCIPRR